MTSAFANPTSLIISFIRNPKNHKTDDMYAIVPAGQFYQITYRDNLNGSQSSSLVTEHEIYDFVENLITLLPVDEDPFTFVQITAPTFPPVLLKTENLKSDEISEAIGNVIKTTVRNWPTTKVMTRSTVSRPVTRSQTSTT